MPTEPQNCKSAGGGGGGGKKNLLAGSCLSSKLFIFVEKLRVCEDLGKQASTRFWNKTKQTKGKTAKRTNCQKRKEKTEVCLRWVFGRRDEERTCTLRNN